MSELEYARCLKKQQQIIEQFSSLPSAEKKYEQIIIMGRSLPTYPAHLMQNDYLIRGCQSTLYLFSSLESGRMHYQIYSDALISAGLAALLRVVYEGESPQTVLYCSPYFLKEIGLFQLLTLPRSHGLRHLYTKMQKDALECSQRLD